MQGVIVKVDIEKPFDSLNWAYLDFVLEKLGFPSKWRAWIKGILASARASVLINGSPSSEFNYSRGLRQGDPLSPFLFIIAMEGLSQIIKQVVAVGVYQGIDLPNKGPGLSHLLFADGVIFIGAWSESNVRNLCRILRGFYLVSGLKVNLAKSSLVRFGVKDEDVEIMAALMNCKKDSLPFRYLGLQVGANMGLAKHWDPIIESFKARLSPWKAKTLSIGGRVTLIRSVLDSLPTYHFALYKAPLKVLDRLDRIRKSFLWNGDEANRRMNWVSWSKVTTPTDFGGLGIAPLRILNLSLLSRWWCRFKTQKHKLWWNAIWALHNNSRFWNPSPIKLSNSGVWKCIFKVNNDLSRYNIDLSKLIMGIVGCGSEICFWIDYWVAESPLYLRFPALFALETNKSVLVNQCFRKHDSAIFWLWRWKRNIFSTIEHNQMNQLMALLARVSFSTKSDRWVWGGLGVESFKVKYVKDLYFSACIERNDYKFPWNNWVPKKVNIHNWRADLNKLPTRATLVHRNIWVPSVGCGLCGGHEETVDHIFISCPIADFIWYHVSVWCKMPPIYVFPFRDLVELHNTIRGNKCRKKAIQTIIFTSCWCIWKHGNEVIFKGKMASPAKVFMDVKVLSKLWVWNRSKKDDLQALFWTPSGIG